MSYTTSTNLQEIAQAYANSIATQLNNVAANIIGVDIMYFRAKPVDEQTDFLFHDYTLYNVEPCPLQFKAVYTNTSYDESNYVFSQLGMDYQSPLELEIDISTWINVTGNTGDEPRSGDIIYIPLTNKLLEVSSMNPGKTSGQVTSYKVSCKKYQPSAHRYVGGSLAESIENNTVNTEKLYGEKIKGSIQDLVDDAQTSAYTISPETDEFKNVAKTNDLTAETILSNPKVECIKDFKDNFTVDGHLVAKYYYDNNILNDNVVEYKTTDMFSSDDYRCLSIWFNIQNNTSMKYKVNSIEILGKEKKNTKIKIVSLGNLNNKFINIERGSIKLYGTMIDDIILVPTSIINKLPEGWNNLTGFTIYESKPNNLLSADGDTKFEININANKYLSITSNSVYTYDLGKNLEYDHWYGLIVNLGKEFNYSLFDSDPNLKLIKENTGLFTWFDDSVYQYYIKSSNMLMTNIRLYNKSNNELSSRLQDLVTYNIPNASNAIINDSADKYLNFKYYSKHLI